MIFPNSEYTAYCDRCGLLIRKTDLRVNESTSKAQRAAKEYGRRWHIPCYAADGAPLGTPALYDMPFAEAPEGDGGRAGGRSSPRRGD